MNWYTYVYRKSDGRNLGRYLAMHSKTIVLCVGTRNSEADLGQVVSWKTKYVVLGTNTHDARFKKT